MKKKNYYGKETFDIFGSLIENKERIKVLSNKKHREVKKEKFSILRIQELQNENEYIKFLEKVIKDIEKSLEKIKTSVEIPIYKLIKENSKPKKEFEIFHLNPEKLIEEINKSTKEELTLYKIILKENTPIIGLTNIIYYDNTNQTLPIGMDLSDEIIIKKSVLDLKNIKKSNFNIIATQKNDIYNMDIKIKKINVLQYDANYKTTKHIKYIKSTNKKI